MRIYSKILKQIECKTLINKHVFMSDIISLMQIIRIIAQ